VTNGQSSGRILSPTAKIMRRLRFCAGVLLSLSLAGSPLALDAQADSTLYVVSYLEATAASQGQVARMLQELAVASRKEGAGAVRYEALRRTPESNQFLLLEIWKDQRALDAHAGAAHTKRFREQVAPLLIAPIDERLCAPTMVAPLRASRGTVYVVTHIDVPGTSRDAALKMMKPFIDQTRGERGNVRFDLTHQSNRTNHFTAIEAWADQKSADAHQTAQHTRTFRREITPLLGALYDQRWYRSIEAQP
jgi:quinol monooxygenase YgiN